MIKTFVLDTNVLLHEPRAILRFEDNEVVLPIYVIEELDRFKRDMSELGRNAREITRLIDGLRTAGPLSKGVPLESGGTFRVAETSQVDKPSTHFAQQHMYDNLILATALEIRDKNPDRKVVFVTQDTNLRIRADAVHLEAVDYDPARVELEELYPGHRELVVEPEGLQAAFEGGLPVEGDEGLHANEYVLLRDSTRQNHTALARYDADDQILKALPRTRGAVFGIDPRNKEQAFALDLLLDDDVKLVTLVGKAGTGKTLLAIAAGMAKVFNEERYDKLLVARPIMPMGRDIGYLPGDKDEKLTAWMQPIFDNLEYI
ncbi:MAG: PhoH family protein, partial [Myxococcales bacterium]|nr:PhoH family protein [Myxococcales bacterium]